MAVPTGSAQTVALGAGVQPQVAENAASDARLVGIWEQDRWLGIGARGVLTARSTDGGVTWSVPAPLAVSSCASAAGPGTTYDRASDPSISVGRNGIAYASALGFSASGYLAAGGLSAVLVARSTDGGATWQVPTALIQDASVASSAGPFYFNDRDAVTADPGSGNVFVAWDRISSDPAMGTPTWLARSTDDGVTWTSAAIYNPGAGAQTFNNHIVLLAGGTVLDVFTLFPSQLTTSLQVLRSSDQGVTWPSSPTKIADIVSLGTTNPITQGSIRDSALMAQVAVDPSSGKIAVVWQQSWNGAAGATSSDGIALSISSDGGVTWTATPLHVNGAPAAAAFSPTVRFLANGTLAVTYYDLRDYIAGSSVLGTDYWLTESTDVGATWREVRIAGPFDLNAAPQTDLNPSVTATGLFLGDNQGLGLTGGQPLPLFAATDAGGAHVYAGHPANPLTSANAHAYSAR